MYILDCDSTPELVPQSPVLNYLLVILRMVTEKYIVLAMILVKGNGLQ